MLRYPRPDPQESSSRLRETQEQHHYVPSSSYMHIPDSRHNSSSQGHGFTRVPCKARGVSNDHNAQNAYIDIPRDAPHGLILRCSNELCVSSGRQFRYCSVCQTPAAKRNFHVRHAHGMSLRKGIRDSTTLNDTPSSPTPPPENRPPLEKRRRSSRKVCGSTEEIAAMAKQAIRELTIEDQAAEEEVREPPKKVVKSVCSEEQRELTPEEIEWLKLLRTRPNFDNNEATTAWISSVIECSLAAEPAEPPPEVKALGDTQIGADDADEILSALGCSDGEKYEEERGKKFQFDFDQY